MALAVANYPLALLSLRACFISSNLLFSAPHVFRQDLMSVMFCMHVYVRVKVESCLSLMSAVAVIKS